ncbi:MAG: phosphomannomutase [Pseudomonadota bacterium]
MARCRSLPTIESLVRFGTSGLRGPASAFTPMLCTAYIRAFLDMALETANTRSALIGMDRRATSPAIAGHCLAAIAAAGWTPQFCGILPTPALAHRAFAEHCPAIMVTGSHIAGDLNGLKFFLPQREIGKTDEADILARLEPDAPAIEGLVPPEPDATAATLYGARYARAFAPDCLKGLTVGIHMHSSAGGDLLVRVVEALGGRAIPFGQSATFVAVDTEALSSSFRQVVHDFQAENSVDAVISTDGDGDRPLLFDRAGAQVPGDLLGCLAARALGIEKLAVPVNVSSAIEKTGSFHTVTRTRIGAPHVLDALNALASSGGAVAGFEANGGFILGSPLALTHGDLPALPTRDAILPLVAVLGQMASLGQSVSELVAALPRRVMVADRIAGVQGFEAQRLLDDLATRSATRQSLDPLLAGPLHMDRTDGVRLILRDGTIVHFRQSGNAPEFRIYVETENNAESTAKVQALMIAVAEAFQNATWEN